LGQRRDRLNNKIGGCPHCSGKRYRKHGKDKGSQRYLGGKETGDKEDGTGKTGRGSSEKTLVDVATECLGKQIGRGRFKCVESASGKNLMRFREDNIEKGSTIVTDC
jgi:hypothetical protein